MYSTISPVHHLALGGNDGVGMWCYFRGIPSVPSLCGFPSLITVVCAEERWGLEKHIHTYVFGGAKIEDGRNIKTVLLYFVQLLHTEPPLKEMSRLLPPQTQKRRKVLLLPKAQGYVLLSTLQETSLGQC